MNDKKRGKEGREAGRGGGEGRSSIVPFAHFLPRSSHGMVVCYGGPSAALLASLL